MNDYNEATVNQKTIIYTYIPDHTLPTKYTQTSQQRRCVRYINFSTSAVVLLKMSPLASQTVASVVDASVWPVSYGTSGARARRQRDFEMRDCINYCMLEDSRDLWRLFEESRVKL